MLKLNLRFIRHISWIILLLSGCIAIAVFFILRDRFYPYQLKITEHFTSTNLFRIYHDFDKDGFSESLDLNIKPATNRYFIHIKNWSSGIIDQTTYWENFEPSSIMFADINADGYDEIFTFTQKDDSLYLYVHDLISKKAIISRLFLTIVQEPLTPYKRNVASFFPGGIADPGLYDHKVIIFAIRSFAALKPRAIYALDLDRGEIIGKFDTHSTLSNLFRYDLDGDGLDEIIVTGVAYGNVPYPVQYRDDTCWLFVLNQKLTPVFPPLNFSEYPAEITCLPIEIHAERFLLVIPDYLGAKKIDDSMYLINAQGKIHLRTQNIFREQLGFSPVIDTHKNPSEIYGWQGDNGLIKLNYRLEPVSQVSTPFKRLRTVACKDLNMDGNEELLCIADQLLTIFDQELKLLSKFRIPMASRLIRVDFQENGPHQPSKISLRIDETFYLLSHNKNTLYTLFPLFFIGLILVIFLLLNGMHKSAIILNLYIRFFKHFIYDSSGGLLLVDHLGKILYPNNQIHQVLNLPLPLARGDNIFSVLSSYPKIIDLFKQSQMSAQPVQQKISLQEKGVRFESEIHIKPFRFPIKSGISYLLHFKTSDISSTSDKIKTWSRAVQKMAHDIKTPLSTVTLNLKALQTRLEKITLSKIDRQELSDDIGMMRMELENIQIMTKNFLKFSNLDKPHFQAFDLGKIIENAMLKYRPYLSPGQDIQLFFDDDLKPVWVDPQQTEIVFHIMLENALAALQGKGLISISVIMAQYLDRSFSEYIEVEIADTGPGISETDKMKIFEPYYTTKPEGTGMGLAIAKKISEDHGGFIDVYSKPNFGAAFRFSLPVIVEEEKNG